MCRLIIVPQYPTPLRYQEWWYTEFKTQYAQRFDEVVILGEKYLEGEQKRAGSSGKDFAPLQAAIELEAEQIKEYAAMDVHPTTDVLLLNDLSYPGLFAHALIHKRPYRCFAIAHATSKNRFDYFENVREVKYPIERSLAGLFTTVFVASNYHQQKLRWKNLFVWPLPLPPFLGRGKYWKKDTFIVSAAREAFQKRNAPFENLFERVTQQQVRRQESTTWEEYYQFLRRANFLLITAREETFGYQIVDALLNECIPIAPRAYSYPELLPSICLYKEQSLSSLLQTVERCRRKHEKEGWVPTLKVQKESEQFFEITAKFMHP